jgi:hypothetical protein
MMNLTGCVGQFCACAAKGANDAANERAVKATSERKRLRMNPPITNANNGTPALVRMVLFSRRRARGEPEPIYRRSRAHANLQ